MSGNSKYIAGTSLVVMAAGFLAMLPFHETAAGYILLGAFEAGLVGGLADWFAVTALFRHPLGLPIPHTSLLSKNRGKMTRALVNAVEQQLLNKTSIAAKMQELQMFRTIVQTVEREMDTDEFRRAVIAVSGAAVRSVPLPEVAEFVEREARKLLGSLDVRRILERVVDAAVERGFDERALDFALERMERWAVKEETRDKLGRLAAEAVGKLEIGGFMQFAVNAFVGYLSEDKLGTMLQQFIVTKLYELRTPGHGNRTALIMAIREALRSMQSNPDVMADIDAWKERLADNPEWKQMLQRGCESARQRLTVYIEEGPFADAFALPFLKRMLRGLSSDADMAARCESWLHRKLTDLLEKHHSKIGVLVRENIERLDDRTLIAMLEDKVGADLQWIRVNGAICGFMIGLVLATVQWFF